MEYEIHDICKAVPEFRETDNYEEYKADILAHGLREPIVLFEGKILDKRHAYWICTENGIPMMFIDFKGTRQNAVDYVWSRLLGRSPTHLQKARIRLKLDDYLTDKRRTGCAHPVGYQRDNLKKDAGVGESTAKAAIKVEKRGCDELKKLADEGRISARQANIVATMPKVMQKTALLEITDPEKYKEVQKKQEELQQKKSEQRKTLSPSAHVEQFARFISNTLEGSLWEERRKLLEAYNDDVSLHARDKLRMAVNSLKERLIMWENLIYGKTNGKSGGTTVDKDRSKISGRYTSALRRIDRDRATHEVETV